MGKGKKKGDKKPKDEPSLSGLSLSDAPAASEETAVAQTVVEKPAPSTSSAPSEAASTVVSATDVAQEDDGLGLFGGGGGKKKPRKKKGSGAQQASAGPQPTSQVAASGPQIPQPIPPVAQQSQQPPQSPGQWSIHPGQPAHLPQAQWAGQPPQGHQPQAQWAGQPGQPPQAQWAGQPPQGHQPQGQWPGQPGQPPQAQWAGQPPQGHQPQAQWAGQPPQGHQPQGQWPGQPGQPPQAQWAGQPPQGHQPQGQWPGQPGQQPQAQWAGQPPQGHQPQAQWAGQPQGQRPPAQWAGQPQGQRPPAQWAGQPQAQQPRAQWAGQPQGQQPQPQRAAQPQGQQPQGPWSQQPQTQQAPQGRPQAKQPSQQAQAQPQTSSTTSAKTPQDPQTTVCHYKIPIKTGPSGLVGCRKIRVLTNYLQMKIKPLKIYRYDVSFIPDKPKKMLSLAYNESKKKNFPNHTVAFDQMKNCYALKPLPKVSQDKRFATQVDIKDANGRTLTFEVSYKFTGMVDLGTIIKYMETKGSSLNPPTEAIQCIDVVLRQGTLESYVKAGRQFFKRPNRPIDLGDGLEMWTGLFQSAIFTSRPFINIDVAHKGFPKEQPLIQALANDFRIDITKPIDMQRGNENFQSFIKNLRVTAKIMVDGKENKREFICNGTVKSARQQKFPLEKDGKTIEMTVEQYFTREKGQRLRYPDLNCMWVGPRNKSIYYPMELLDIVYGQARNKQLNDIQLSNMVRQAATPPDDRKRKIEEVITSMNYSSNPYFKEFGLDIANQFYAVDAKVLTPPKIDVGGQSVEPRRGVWQNNRLLKAQPMEAWGFIAIDLDPNASNYENIKSLIMSCGRQMGMKVGEPMRPAFNVRIVDLQKHLHAAASSGIAMLFIVVATRGRDYYHRVKQIAEKEVGILTQCIRENTASRRMNPQTAKNILLKVNSKLMGINQALDNNSLPKCLQGDVMVVGADVTHPSPDQSSIPSIAAVTASIDPKCYIYNIELSIQPPKKEMIMQFEEMMIDHLRVYRERQRKLPRKIYIYRDGVSEGQFAAVMNSELKAVINAYQKLAGPQVKPEVLFLLVQKRHHTRLFLGDRNIQNVEPGTVVDTDIVHASELDFYLVSHQAIKGTARPTRYHVVCNDGRIPDDEVEQMTYYLCHLYSRCPRSVSYPTPTYYAHLACLRARSLTYGETFENSALEKQPQRLRVLSNMLAKSRMFFV